MSISYIKARTAARSTSASRSGVSMARRELRYALEQYNRLTSELEAAKVANNDRWRKEQVNTRELYSQRAAAAAQMARYAAQVLDEPAG